MQAVWERMRVAMAPGALDPLVKAMIHVAVPVTNGCDYCIASHAAAARAKGMTGAQLPAVIAMASQANALARAPGVGTDARVSLPGAPG